MAVMTALLCGGVPATASSDKEALFDLLVEGGIPELKAVLEAGADVRARLLEGNTALHLAVMLSREPDFIKVLLEAGADPHQTNDHGQTVLMLAERSKYRDELISMMNTHASAQTYIAVTIGSKDEDPNTRSGYVWSLGWNFPTRKVAIDTVVQKCLDRGGYHCKQQVKVYQGGCIMLSSGVDRGNRFLGEKSVTHYFYEHGANEHEVRKNYGCQTCSLEALRCTE